MYRSGSLRRNERFDSRWAFFFFILICLMRSLKLVLMVRVGGSSSLTGRWVCRRIRVKERSGSIVPEEKGVGDDAIVCRTEELDGRRCLSRRHDISFVRQGDSMEVDQFLQTQILETKILKANSGPYYQRIRFKTFHVRFSTTISPCHAIYNNASLRHISFSQDNNYETRPIPIPIPPRLVLALSGPSFRRGS